MNAFRLQSVRDFLERMSAPALFLYGIAGVVLIGFLDHAVGPDYSVYVFYFIPIMLVTEFGGLPAGLALSLASAAVWLVADYYSGPVPPHSGVRLWNGMIRFLSFLLIAAMQHLLRRERRYARTDFLTKLANRQYFYEEAEKELSRSKRYALPLTVAYIDLDDFKRINDRYGHMTGNQLLRAVAGVFRTHLRDEDTAARLGGDEFALILPRTGGEAAEAVLSKLHALLKNAMRERRWPVTFSIGAVTFHTMPDSVSELIKAVDSRMYAVKAGGKNGIKIDDVS